MAASSTSSTIIHLLHGQPFMRSLQTHFLSPTCNTSRFPSYRHRLQLCFWILSHSFPSSHQHHVDRIPSWCPSEMLSVQETSPKSAAQMPTSNVASRGFQGMFWWIWFRPMIFIVRFHGTSENTVVLLTPAEGGSTLVGHKVCDPMFLPANLTMSFCHYPTGRDTLEFTQLCSTNIPKQCKQEGFSPGW